MEENMRRAQKRDAVNTGTFFFRKSLVPEDVDEDEEAEPDSATTLKSHDHEYTEMSINTIINGKVSWCKICTSLSLNLFLFFTTFSFFLPQDEFPGLVSLVRMYVNSIDVDVDTRCTILQYLRCISKKAAGKKSPLSLIFSSPSLLFSLLYAPTLPFLRGTVDNSWLDQETGTLSSGLQTGLCCERQGDL
jgi:hypothetical protein